MSTTTLNTMNKKSNNLNLKMILMMRVKKKNTSWIVLINSVNRFSLIVMIVNDKDNDNELTNE